MNYVIVWAHKETGRRGRSPKTFTLEDATALATELNLDYPTVHHVAVLESDAPAALKHIDDPQPQSAGPVSIERLSDSSPNPVKGLMNGRPMGSLPAGYLDWLRGQPWLTQLYPAVALYIEQSAKAIDQDLKYADR